MITAERKFVGVNHVCESLGVSRATLYRWVAAGLPSYQPGGPNGRRLFDLEEVQTWVRSRCSDPAADRWCA